MKSFHQIIFILLSVIAVIWTGCEGILDDTNNPHIKLINPQKSDSYKVPDTIQVKAKITDDENIEWVKVALVDNNGQSICSSISIENIDGKEYLLNEKYPLDNMQLETDEYNLRVETSDGPNTTKEERYLTINKLEKKIKNFLVITKSNSEEVSVTKLDSNYGNKQFIFSEPTDYLDSRYNSSNQQLIISGKTNYDTKAFNIPDFTMEWSVPVSGNSQNSSFTSLEANDNLFALGSSEGFIELFYKDGNNMQKLHCNSGLHPYELEIMEERVAAAEKVSAVNYVTLYYTDGGIIDEQKSIGGEIIGLHTRKGDYSENTRLVIIGNKLGRGCIWHYRINDNNLWKASELTYEKIYTTCKISDENYLAGTGKHIREHTYDPGSTVRWVENMSPDRLEYEPVTKTVIAIKNKTIYFYDWESASLKNTVQMNDQVLNVHFVYNK